MVDVGSPYPMWKYYPSRSQAPTWVAGVTSAFEKAQPDIDSKSRRGITSDAALAILRPALVLLGFEVEASKSRADKLTRPVLFGEVGRTVVAYEVDGFHPQYGIVLESAAHDDRWSALTPPTSNGSGAHRHRLVRRRSSPRQSPTDRRAAERKGPGGFVDVVGWHRRSPSFHELAEAHRNRTCPGQRSRPAPILKTGGGTSRPRASALLLPGARAEG